MDMYYPFTKPLDNLEYLDVEVFCKQGVSENIYLDYKLEIKGDKLSQSIASFANTKGGILLIGVNEDKTTKLPDKWDGIDDNGTLSETINQIIANVTPIPTCRFAVVPHKTKGKAFVVLVIEEGASAPYFTVHKPVVYIRTGDVSKLIDQSDRASLLELSERGKIADAKIQSSLDLTNEIFDERYKRARDNYRAEQEQARSPSPHPMSVIEQAVNTDYLTDMYGYTSPLVIGSITPINPNELTDQKTMYDQQHSFKYGKGQHLVPPMSTPLDPVRYGIATRNDHAFSIANRQVRYMYVSKYGLIQIRRELNETDHKYKIELLNLFNALHTVINTIRYASTYYTHFNYSGSLRLVIELANLDKDIQLVGSTVGMYDDNIVEIDLENYDWAIELSTHDLNTDKIKDILTGLFTNIYLDLGFRNLPSDTRGIIDSFEL